MLFFCLKILGGLNLHGACVSRVWRVDVLFVKEKEEKFGGGNQRGGSYHQQ
jgi:hypothetical protein